MTGSCSSGRITMAIGIICQYRHTLSIEGISYNMSKTKLFGFALVLSISAFTTPVFAQSVPANVASIAHGQGSNLVSPQIILTPGLLCTVSVGQPHYSTYDSTRLGENSIDTHTYVSCNNPADSLQPVAYLYVLVVFGTSTYWEQMPARIANPVYNKSSAKSPQSKDACTYGESW